MRKNVHHEASIALKQNFSGTIGWKAPFVVGVDDINSKIMKLTATALASGFALFSTFALANTDHHPSVVRHHRGTLGMVHLHPNYGNPDGPATLSGAGKDYAVPGWSDEQTQYWIDNATGPKD